MYISVSHINSSEAIKEAIDRVLGCAEDMWNEGVEIEETPQEDDEKIVFREFVATDALVKCFTVTMKRSAVSDLNPNVCAYITYALLQRMGIVRYRRLWGRYVDWATRREIWSRVKKELSAVPPFWRDQRGINAWMEPKIKKMRGRKPAHYDAYVAFVCSVVFALTTEDGHLRPELIIGGGQRRIV